MTQSQRSLISSSGLLLSAIVGLGLSISTPKFLRVIPLAATMTLACTAASFAQKGIRPAELEAMDKAAELACAEAERENALEEIQETDDDDRELSKYERKLNIEAEAMRRTLPTQLELRQMRHILNPPQQVVVSAGQHLEQPSLNPLESSITPVGLFDWNGLKDVDLYPVLVVIGGMGAGKSKTVKWLAKHVLRAQVRACDSYGRKKEWSGATLYSDSEEALMMMANDLEAIESEKHQYQAGKSDFPERLTVLEEAPDTISELRQLNRKWLRGKNPDLKKEIIDPWLLKHFTFTRKLRRRLVAVSVSMNATEFIPAEHRSKAISLFPGTAVQEIMADTTYYKLGTRQNAQLRAELSKALTHAKNPCLIYCRGRWHVGSLPDLSLEGDPVFATTPELSQPIEPPSNAQKLEKLLDIEFPEEETDR